MPDDDVLIGCLMEDAWLTLEQVAGRLHASTRVDVTLPLPLVLMSVNAMRGRRPREPRPGDT
jgi:hypothetical protein